MKRHKTRPAELAHTSPSYLYVKRTNVSTMVKNSLVQDVFNTSLGMLQKYLMHQHKSIIWVGVKNHSNQAVVYKHALIPSGLL